MSTTMSNYDISQLKITAEPADISPDEYVAPQGGDFDPVPKGTYNTILIDGKFKTDSGKTQPIRVGTANSRKSGKTYLQANVAVKITDGQYKGRIIYGRVNTIPFKYIFNEVEPERADASAMLDLITASGGTVPEADSQAYIDTLVDLVEREAAQKTTLDWSVYCSPNAKEYNGDGFSLRGMKNFPQEADGSYNPRVDHELPSGEVVTLLAQNEIKGFWPAKR
jgi:hypothetical protein